MVSAVVSIVVTLVPHIERTFTPPGEVDP